MEQKDSNKFLHGAAVLAVAGLLVKVMGVFFRIPLTNWVGAEGMSYYSSVYPFYTFFLLISLAGIPVAISRMISERTAVKNYGGAHRVFNISVWLLGGLGFVSFLIMHIGAGFIETVVLNNPGTRYAIQAIAPSLFLVPVMAAYRGYFQGRQNMNPTAVSQLVEQLFRVCVGLSLGYYLISAGYDKFAAGAIFGCTAGAGAGLTIAIIIYLLNRNVIMTQIRRNKHNEEIEPWQKIVKEIIVIAVPITIGACIVPLINAIDSMMVMRRLQAVGFSLTESRVLFGKLGGYCASIAGMPQVLIQAIVMSLVPAIAAAYKLKSREDLEENTQFAMRATMIIAFPCTIGMMVLSYPILLMFYPMQAEEVSSTALVLAIMAIETIPMSPMVTLTGVLQGVDKQMLPVKNLAIGAVVKVILTYILVGIRPINVNGASIGSIACSAVAFYLDARDVRKETGITFNMKDTYLKPFISSAVMGVASILSYKLFMLVLKSNMISCLLAIIVSVLVYGVMILVTGTISLEEIEKLPKGDKLTGLIRRFIK